jgi:hypothetical protein
MATLTVARNIFQASRRRLLDRSHGFVLQRGFASYPPHQVVGLPSLSPVRTCCCTCLEGMSARCLCMLTYYYLLLPRRWRRDPLADGF